MSFKSFVCFFVSESFSLCTANASIIKIKIKKSITKSIERKKATKSPKEMKIWKTTKVPKSKKAQEAPSKKLVIFSNASFCIAEP